MRIPDDPLGLEEHILGVINADPWETELSPNYLARLGLRGTAGSRRLASRLRRWIARCMGQRQLGYELEFCNPLSPGLSTDPRIRSPWLARRTGQGDAGGSHLLVRRKRAAEAAEAVAAARDGIRGDNDWLLVEAEVLEAEGRRNEAEKRYHTLAADVALPASLRVRATARLAGLLLDRNDHGGAFTVADRAVAELGPHPDLLDARASARAGTGNVAGAISDFTDAVLVPTPTSLLHLAYGEARAEDFRGAMAALEQAVEAGLDAPNLRPMDRQCLDDIVQRLGLSRVPAGSP